MSEPIDSKNTTRTDGDRSDESFRLLSSVGGVGDDLLEEAASFSEKASKPARAGDASEANKGTGSKIGSFFRSHKAGLIAAALAVVLTAGILIPVFLAGRPADSPLPGFSDDPVVDPSVPTYLSDAVTDVPDALRRLTVKAESADGEPVTGRVIPVKAALRVETASAVDTETFSRYVQVSPALPLSVTRESDTVFRLEPAATAFAPNTVYRLTVGDADNPVSSFAFQTASEPRIQSVFPADLSIEVPVDTGIEIVFSEPVRQADLASRFSIEPEVTGSFQQSPDGKTVAFVPDKDLAEDTVYTVRIDDGITGISGKPISDSRSFSFRTRSGRFGRAAVEINPTVRSAFGGESPRVVFIPGDTVVISTYLSLYETDLLGERRSFVSSQNTADAFRKGKVQLKAEISRAKDVRAVSESLLDSLKRVHALEAVFPEPDRSLFQKTAEWSFAQEDERNLMFTARGHLDEEGVYLVTVTATYGSDSVTRHSLINVSSLRYGSLTSDGQTLLYLTDGAGNALAGASVDGYAIGSAQDENGSVLSAVPYSIQTGSDGTAFIGNGESPYLLFRVSKDGHELLAFGEGATADTNPYYLHALYTDRSVYFSTDTIRVWGAVRKQYTDHPLDFGQFYLSSSFDSRNVPVLPDENGLFTAEIPIEDVGTVWGSVIRLTDEEGRTVASRSVRVTREEKPVVRPAIRFDRPFYAYGETISGAFTLSFFDGTPAPGYEIHLECSHFSLQAEDMVTDQNGEIRFTIPTGRVSADSTEPVMIRVRGYLTGEGTDRVTVSDFIPYYHSDYVFGVRREESGLLVTLNKRDLSGFPDHTVGEPADGEISVTLIKYWTVLSEKTKYDPYSKRRYTVYSSDIRHADLETRTLTFENGVVRLDYRKPESSMVWYNYRIRFNDGHIPYTDEYSASGYRFSNPSTVQQYNLTADRSACVPGETVQIRLRKEDAPVTALYAFYSNGYHAHTLGTQASIRFTDDMIPNLCCYALYFKPETAEIAVASLLIPYDTEHAVREMTVKTDRDRYRPGEAALITVSAPGLAGGKALISLTDEACFALGENDFTLLSFFQSSAALTESAAYRAYTLNRFRGIYGPYFGIKPSGTFFAINPYSDVLFFSDSSASDYKSINSDGAPAEASPEIQSPPDSGTVYIRERFEDTAVFAVVSIGTDGTGTLRIDLPDNLTEWRATAIGFRSASATSDLALGMAVSGAIVTLPVQVKAELNASYVAGDSVIAGFRCFGEQAEGKASYTLTLTGEDGTELRKGVLTGDAGTVCYASFGKLDPGSYELTVVASCAGGTDALRRTFTVLPSAQTVLRTTDVTGADTLVESVEPSVFPVTVRFRNETEEDLLLHRIADTLRYASGSAQRLDAAAASMVARSWLNSRYGTEEAVSTDGERLKAFLHTDRGGVSFYALFPYAEGNPGLTAQLLDLVPEQIPDKSLLIRSFRNVLNGTERLPTEEELCQSLYGLSVLGEAILDTVSLIAGSAGNYSPEAKLYLANAFASLGDYGSAASILNSLIAEYGTEADNGNALYLKTGDKESDIRVSSLALQVASRVSRKTAVKLATYLTATPHASGESPDLALASFLIRALPTGDAGKKTVRYTLADGREQVLILKPGQSASVRLFKADFEAFRMTNPDRVSVTAVYTGAPDPDADKANPAMKVHKFIEGNVVHIRISGRTDKRYDWLNIDEVIPSGARFSGANGHGVSKEGTNCSAYLYNREGQQVKGHVGVSRKDAVYRPDDNSLYCDPYDFEIELTYLLREAIAGEFAVEPVRVTDSAGAVSCSEPSKVTFLQGAAVTELGLPDEIR